MVLAGRKTEIAGVVGAVAATSDQCAHAGEWRDATRRRRTTSPPDRSAITGACYVGMPTGHEKSVGKRGHQSITKLILYHQLESKACFSLSTWKLSLPILLKNKTRLGIVFNRDENGRRRFRRFHFHIFYYFIRNKNDTYYRKQKQYWYYGNFKNKNIRSRTQR